MAGDSALHSARDHGLLVVVDDGDPLEFPELDAGESSALSAAMAHHAAVVIDERKARAFIARHPELRARVAYVTGLIGLLQVAKHRDYIDAVRPILDQLISQGFRVSRRLYEATLQEMSELE